MTQTPFGQVVGRKTTTDSLNRGDVLNLVSKAKVFKPAPEIPLPPLTAADTSIMGEVAALLTEYAENRPDCTLAVVYYDTTGDGDGDTWMIGLNCRF